MSNRVNFILPCPCGGHLTTVVDSRPAEEFGLKMIRRRRRCEDCGKRANTLEVSREDFTSLQRAELVRMRETLDGLIGQLDVGR